MTAMVTPVSYPFVSVIAASKQLPCEAHPGPLPFFLFAAARPKRGAGPRMDLCKRTRRYAVFMASTAILRACSRVIGALGEKAPAPVPLITP